ncbi:MAG: hypothetical protein M3Y33_16795, partial [Actinomycetota bacterium]|nr:hypothetical protein [Actinomycetota bacterium]
MTTASDTATTPATAHPAWRACQRPTAPTASVHHAADQLALNERGRTLSGDQLFDTIGTTYA